MDASGEPACGDGHEGARSRRIEAGSRTRHHAVVGGVRAVDKHSGARALDLGGDLDEPCDLSKGFRQLTATAVTMNGRGLRTDLMRKDTCSLMVCGLVTLEKHKGVARFSNHLTAC